MRWLRRQSSKTIAVKVSTLESDLEFSIPVKSTGKDLFDLVCGTFGLRETWYFGLQSYVLVSDGSIKYLNWLKPEKILSQHSVPLPFQFCYFFHAKYFPEDVEHELIQPVTKHLFYLEVKDKIENRGRSGHLGVDGAFIQPSLEAAVQLTVLSAQIEFEDFPENELDDEAEQLALSKRLLRLLPKYLPINVQINAGIAQRLKECYRNNKGLNREEAEIRYLKIAQSFRLFGVDYFVVTCVRMKDPRTLSLTRYFSKAEFSSWRTLDRHQELSWVGITAAGIQLFAKNQVDRARYTFPWNIIKNVSYRERKFTVKLNTSWRPSKKSGGAVAGRQTAAPSCSSPGAAISAPHTPSISRRSPSRPGTPVSGKRALSRPPLPPPPPPPAQAMGDARSGKYLSAASHQPRGQLVGARNKAQCHLSPGVIDVVEGSRLEGKIPEPSSQVRDPTETFRGYGGGHPYRSTISASPASDFAGAPNSGAFGGSGVSSGGSVASGPVPTSRHAATVIEMWLAEPYQAKNIIHLCAGNHSLFMRRRQPDSVDVQQMKAQAREERIRRGAERALLERARSEKAAALKLNAALESRCAQLESALRSTTAATAASVNRQRSPGGGSYNSDHSLTKGDGEKEVEEQEGELDDVGDVGDAEGGDEVEEGDHGGRPGVQFATGQLLHQPSTTSPIYARLRHHQRQRRQTAQYRRCKEGASQLLAPPQAPSTGIYEGFLWSQSPVAASVPTQSEPAIPQMIPWSPALVRQPRGDLTSLTFSRPPSMPPRPARVTQSLERLPYQQMVLNPARTLQAPVPIPSHPPTSSISLHSFHGGQQYHQQQHHQTGPQVVPSISSNYQMFPKHFYGSRNNQQEPGNPWQYPRPLGGSTHRGRLYNGFSYPGHLNHLTSSNLVGEEAGTQCDLISPPPRSTSTVSGGSRRVFDVGGAQATHVEPSDVILPQHYQWTRPIESFQSMSHLASTRRHFQPTAQSLMWSGGLPTGKYPNPYMGCPYMTPGSGGPMCYYPLGYYRGSNQLSYFDTGDVHQLGFGHYAPCAPVSMPILNGEDDFYLSGGGETEELPGPPYFQPAWLPYYDPYWNWMRATAGSASVAASSTGLESRAVRWPPAVPPAPVVTANASLNAMLSPYAGPTRRRMHQQKMAAAKQLQKQQHQQPAEGQAFAQLPPKRQVYRGISLQDLPSRTRSDSETVGHARERSASRPSLVRADASTDGTSGGGGGGDASSPGYLGASALEDQQPPRIFTSPPPPSLLLPPTATQEDRMRIAYQQMHLHRQLWEEWVRRTGTTCPPDSSLPSKQRKDGDEHGQRRPSDAYEYSGGGSSLRRVPPPPSYQQFMVSGTSPQSGYQMQLGIADSRDPSGPDGSSSVGYVGVDIHGTPSGASGPGFVGGYSPGHFEPSPLGRFSVRAGDEEDEGNEVGATEEYARETQRPLSRSSFSGLRRGQHPGSVDRLSTIACIAQSPDPSYISNVHLYANMTLVDGQLVPLMGRPAPPLQDHPAFLPPFTNPARPSPPPLNPAPRCSAPSISTASGQSRPLTKYHSSQTVWLTNTGGICDQEALVTPRKAPQSAKPLQSSPAPPLPPPQPPKCVVFQDSRWSQSNK
uniref:FERM domain-containing protein n=3 Tax=Mesocestoides corti TaxID=53468 RepID=A0A5K3F333_MESCO